MPRAARKPCAYPLCGTLVTRGQRFCGQHEQASRGNAAERGYDAAWRKLRAWWLRQHPLCACDDCQEGKVRLTVAEVVDHIKPIAERPDLRLDSTNLRSMAKECHDRHTARTRWGTAGVAQGGRGSILRGRSA